MIGWKYTTLMIRLPEPFVGAIQCLASRNGIQSVNLYIEKLLAAEFVKNGLDARDFETKEETTEIESRIDERTGHETRLFLKK